MTSKGFTMIELVMALVGIAVLAVAAVGFLMTVLSQRDQAVAEATVTQQAEVVFPIVGKVIRQAKTITVTNGGHQLETTRLGECWTFAWDQGQQALMYGQQKALGCTPPAAGAALTPKTVRVTAINFQLVDAADTGKSVQLDMDVTADRPFWQANQHFTQAWVNVVD